MSKAEVLRRVRAALAAVDDLEANGAAAGVPTIAADVTAAATTTADVTAAAAPTAPTPWEYGRPTAVDDVVSLFIERVEDYKADVRRAALEDVPNQIAQCLAEAQAKTVALPPGLDESWVTAVTSQGLVSRCDQPPLSKQVLDQTDAVITAACVGMAETGTIVLDHRPNQGRRIISLLPDTHICVIRGDQIVTDVPEAMARLSLPLQSGQPLTWISGPSATSDIELQRVEGVHGPRQLYVIVAE